MDSAGGDGEEVTRRKDGQAQKDPGLEGWPDNSGRRDIHYSDSSRFIQRAICLSKPPL